MNQSRAEEIVARLLGNAAEWVNAAIKAEREAEQFAGMPKTSETLTLPFLCSAAEGSRKYLDYA